MLKNGHTVWIKPLKCISCVYCQCGLGCLCAARMSLHMYLVQYIQIHCIGKLKKRYVILMLSSSAQLISFEGHACRTVTSRQNISCQIVTQEMEFIFMTVTHPQNVLGWQFLYLCLSKSQSDANCIQKMWSNHKIFTIILMC